MRIVARGGFLFWHELVQKSTKLHPRRVHVHVRSPNSHVVLLGRETSRHLGVHRSRVASLSVMRSTAAAVSRRQGRIARTASKASHATRWGRTTGHYGGWCALYDASTHGRGGRRHSARVSGPANGRVLHVPSRGPSSGRRRDQGSSRARRRRCSESPSTSASLLIVLVRRLRCRRQSQIASSHRILRRRKSVRTSPERFDVFIVVVCSMKRKGTYVEDRGVCGVESISLKER